MNINRTQELDWKTQALDRLQVVAREALDRVKKLCASNMALRTENQYLRERISNLEYPPLGARPPESEPVREPK